MLNYIYIVAYIPNDDTEKTLSFLHYFITAANDEDAYGIGMETHDDSIPGKLVNNYVIPIPQIYPMGIPS
jgi:hypothetical protein